MLEFAPQPEGYIPVRKAGLQSETTYLYDIRRFSGWSTEALRGEFPYAEIDYAPGINGFLITGQDAVLRDMRKRLGPGFEDLFPEVI